MKVKNRIFLTQLKKRKYWCIRRVSRRIRKM